MPRSYTFPPSWDTCLMAHGQDYFVAPRMSRKEKRRAWWRQKNGISDASAPQSASRPAAAMVTDYRHSGGTRFPLSFTTAFQAQSGPQPPLGPQPTALAKAEQLASEATQQVRQLEAQLRLAQVNSSPQNAAQPPEPAPKMLEALELKVTGLEAKVSGLEGTLAGICEQLHQLQLAVTKAIPLPEAPPSRPDSPTLNWKAPAFSAAPPPPTAPISPTARAGGKVGVAVPPKVLPPRPSSPRPATRSVSAPAIRAQPKPTAPSGDAKRPQTAPSPIKGADKPGPWRGKIRS